MKVIVASDKSLTANIVRGALQQSDLAPVEVAFVESPDALPAHLADDAVLIVDWDLGEQAGASFVARARLSSKLPILIACAKSQENSVSAGLKAGADGLVRKPFDAIAFAHAVANAAKAGHKEKTRVNVEFINPFIQATITVFQTMCGIAVERKKLFLKEDYRMFGDVSGVMGLSGDATGSVVISMPVKLACLVVGRMLGEEPADSINNSVRDGIGEVINMVSGNAKAALVNTRYHFNISLPSVVAGSGHEITHRTGTPNIVVLFGAAGMEFAIQVCLAPTE